MPPGGLWPHHGWTDHCTLIIPYGWGFQAMWPSRCIWRHAQHDMTPVISSTGPCQVRCVSLDVATILCIGTLHDREGPAAWPYAQQERDILTREDKKDQNGLVLAHDGDTLSDPGAYFS